MGNAVGKAREATLRGGQGFPHLANCLQPGLVGSGVAYTPPHGVGVAVTWSVTITNGVVSTAAAGCTERAVTEHCWRAYYRATNKSAHAVWGYSR